MRDSPPGSTQEACLDAFDEYSALSIFGADATIEIVDLPPSPTLRSSSVVERSAVNRLVAGSNPACGANIAF